MKHEDSARIPPRRRRGATFGCRPSIGNRYSSFVFRCPRHSPPVVERKRGEARKGTVAEVGAPAPPQVAAGAAGGLEGHVGEREGANLEAGAAARGHHARAAEADALLVGDVGGAGGEAEARRHVGANGEAAVRAGVDGGERQATKPIDLHVLESGEVSVLEPCPGRIITKAEPSTNSKLRLPGGNRKIVVSPVRTNVPSLNSSSALD